MLASLPSRWFAAAPRRCSHVPGQGLEFSQDRLRRPGYRGRDPARPIGPGPSRPRGASRPGPPSMGPGAGHGRVGELPSGAPGPSIRSRSMRSQASASERRSASSCVEQGVPFLLPSLDLVAELATGLLDLGHPLPKGPLQGLEFLRRGGRLLPPACQSLERVEPLHDPLRSRRRPWIAAACDGRAGAGPRRPSRPLGVVPGLVGSSNMRALSGVVHRGPVRLHSRDNRGMSCFCFRS